ncbi:MAG TPA: LLM class flavin-dependent oxidoreductase [Iamia sp.]|nr:LLM class flavin-dependent oxidoreductase [Iamia sp.]
MRIGIQSAQLGPLADPAAVRSVAVAAEQLGYASIWVVDRLPIRTAPRRTLDPIAVMAAIAAVTSRVRVGSGVLVAPWYRPAVLARALTSLDVLSGGRIDVGLGVGGPDDEQPTADRSVGDEGGLEDLLDVLDSHWGVGAPADLRPVQRPRPPVLLAASTASGRDRVARRADGWMPAGVPIEALGPMWADLRDRAAGHGRDADALRLVVRADIELAERPLGPGRATYHGTIDQVVVDVEATRRAGADEVVLRLGGAAGVDQLLDACARIAEGVGPDTAVPVSRR